VRLDRWLWAARFYKTRAQAKSAIEAGRVDFHSRGSAAPARQGVPGAEYETHELPAQKPKVSREISIGDVLTIRRGWAAATVVVRGLSEQRGSAPVAQALYEETLDSIERREAESARRQMERAGLKVPPGRPSKHDRRALQRLKQEH